MKEIMLTQGKKAIVDDADFKFLNCLKWHAVRDGRNVYASHSSFGRMHRLLTSYKEGFDVDHVDGNGLNNQRSNLRLCKHAENNRKQRKGLGCLSKYKGVSKCGKNRPNWMAQIRFNYKRIYLGSFPVEIDAAKAYDEAAKKYFGKFTNLNFPGGIS